MELVISPGILTAIPSAIVSPVILSCLFFNKLYIAGNFFVCIPYIFILGLIDFAAIAIPEINPPPPIGIIKQSRSGILSKNSIPIVP